MFVIHLITKIKTISQRKRGSRNNNLRIKVLIKILKENQRGFCFSLYSSSKSWWAEKKIPYSDRQKRWISNHQLLRRAEGIKVSFPYFSPLFNLTVYLFTSSHSGATGKNGVYSDYLILIRKGVKNKVSFSEKSLLFVYLWLEVVIKVWSKWTHNTQRVFKASKHVS